MGWTKLFNNNETICEPNSWSRTALDNMRGVQLIHSDKLLAIYGPGQYWQSDSYESDIVLVGNPTPKLISRRIEKYIDYPCAAKVTEDNYGLIFDFRTLTNKLNDAGMYWVSRTDELPIWLILQLNVDSNRTSYYFSKDKI